MCLAELSLTAFLFVVMKNGLSSKRTESCLCCTRNTVIKCFGVCLLLASACYVSSYTRRCTKTNVFVDMYTAIVVPVAAYN